jgi:hypothetical protein
MEFFGYLLAELLNFIFIKLTKWKGYGKCLEITICNTSWIEKFLTKTPLRSNYNAL